MVESNRFKESFVSITLVGSSVAALITAGKYSKNIALKTLLRFTKESFKICKSSSIASSEMTNVKRLVKYLHIVHACGLLISWESFESV